MSENRVSKLAASVKTEPKHKNIKLRFQQSVNYY